MRFVVTVICILAAACAAWSSPIWVSGSGISSDSQYVPVDDGREIKWEQLPHNSVAFVSQLTESIQLDVETADDFLCNDPDPIRAIEWWGYYSWDENPTVEYFIVRFYAPDVAAPAYPGVLLYEQPVMTFTKEQVLDPAWIYFWRYTCSLPVPFGQTPGETYWLCIQQVTDYELPNWYWMTCAVDDWWGYESTMRGEYVGYPDWTQSTEFWGFPEHMAFVLYDEIVSPVEETSWGSIKAMFR